MLPLHLKLLILELTNEYMCYSFFFISKRLLFMVVKKYLEKIWASYGLTSVITYGQWLTMMMLQGQLRRDHGRLEDNLS